MKSAFTSKKMEPASCEIGMVRVAPTSAPMTPFSLLRVLTVAVGRAARAVFSLL